MVVGAMNAKALTSALGGKWYGSYGKACCPAHKDKTPSLQLKDSPQTGKLLLYRFGGCHSMDVIAVLRKRGLWEGEGGTAAPSPSPRRDYEAERRERFKERLWRRAWAEAVPALGSPVERWLEVRRIDAARLDLAALPLRWHPRCPLQKGGAPAMLALMTDPSSNKPVGIHRTYLTADGSAKLLDGGSRLMLGHAGICRLSRDEDVELGLGICEGIENGLTVMGRGWRPISACLSLNMLTRFPVLAGIEHLTIFTDAKEQEIAGAEACAARWLEAGREVDLRIPRGGDWNALETN
jgi:hypothetical protein